MRSFSEIERELGLKKFLSSSLGTLFFVPSAPGSPRTIVRFFDSDLETEFVSVFAEIWQACHRWLAASSVLENLVRVELPVEVGVDFIARPHHTYYVSTDTYTAEEDDPPEVPLELGLMRAEACKLLDVPCDQKAEIVKSVMKRSLLEPTAKTYFNSDEKKFIVVEPKIEAGEVRRWAEI